jgi:hypothetical protein
MRETIFELPVGAIEKDEHGTVYVKVNPLKNDEMGIQLLGLGFSSDCLELEWETLIISIDEIKDERNFLHTKAAEHYDGNQYEAFSDLLSMKQLKNFGHEDYVNSPEGKQVMAGVKQKIFKLSAFRKEVAQAMFFNGVKVTIGIYPKDFTLPQNQIPPSAAKWEGMKVVSFFRPLILSLTAVCECSSSSSNVCRPEMLCRIGLCSLRTM